jgi:hypothetical protein
MVKGQQYLVQQPQISMLLGNIKAGIIAIPEIQRPFVWDPVQVRNLMDSLYQGFPIGFLIGWKNPDVKLKDGSNSFGKHILIDGQQRVTALMAALLGEEVVNKSYKKDRIVIAFHPIRQIFEVSNPAIRKDATWIPDIAELFKPTAGLFTIVNEYCSKNPEAKQEDVAESIQTLLSIQSNQVGLIELDHHLDIDTVTEIFIRVNSAGKPLSQADFAMSKIAVNESYGGNALRKAIDYFCHLAVVPGSYADVKHDSAFTSTEFFPKLQWLKDETDDLYDPSYTDMLRVAFTSEFKRGRLADLVALLSGRNFQSKMYEEEVIEQSFKRLKRGVLRFMNEYNYKQFILILKSSGFVDSAMIGSANAVNFAYILYLTLRDMNIPAAQIERTVRRWFVMSLLTGRHSGSFETRFDQDVRMLTEGNPIEYAESLFSSELSDGFWNSTFPAAMRTSVARAIPFQLYKAAQIKLHDRGFLSRDYEALQLVTVKSDVHHLFPRDFLKKAGVLQSQYNQIANFVLAQSEINIQIGNKPPSVYFSEMREQVNGGPQKYGNITEPDELRENYRMNCIPEGVEEMELEDYPAFLEARRLLMAKKIRTYFESL